MNITRWNPASRNLSNWMDEFFNNQMSDLMSTEDRGIQPDVNVKETDKSYELELAAPGMKKDDFNIEVEDGQLKLSAEQKEEHEEKENGKYLRREFQYTSFERSFMLPENVNADKIKAKYTDGVLNVTVPKEKPTPTQPRRIEIG